MSSSKLGYGALDFGIIATENAALHWTADVIAAAFPARSGEWRVLGVDNCDVRLRRCESGGTGRRARLRIWYPEGYGGSSPSFRIQTGLGRTADGFRHSPTLSPKPYGLGLAPGLSLED